MDKDLKELASEILQRAMEDMLEKLKSGEASSQDIGNILRFCKDNNISVDTVRNPTAKALGSMINMPFNENDLEEVSEA